jgi:hypothetical protein
VPTCQACPADAVVHWNRRPNAAELATLLTAEGNRRAVVLLQADPEQPPPVFPDLPTVADFVVAVYACAAHGITLDLASRIHSAACSGTASVALPQCDCTPEALPTAEADPAPVAPALPAGWG